MISESHISFDFERFFIYLKVIGNLKTVIIMAKLEIKHLDSFYDKNFLSVTSEIRDDFDIISIYGIFQKVEFMVDLDKSTAIKFSKTLRTEINKIK